ncbi:PASTA domain [[Clostridium] sordellii]|uniref:PASTA domain-containing protein n=1 Tax=Paraclostridium sordellii TaxID=1505 RepID=UPI0005E7623C|nr:PASTA domain-containing protein [Paeniclostridium sordellii]MDU1456056.1 PASTA domain-containing protein [Paeniclostridium sordellii]CEO04747.1 PASTA domain [[Clostridium] sordellii] [Paeniclostridium sordellii]
MRRVLIISAIVGIISIIFILGLILGKFSNTKVIKTDEKNIKSKIENRSKENIKSDDYEYIKIPDFKGSYKSDVNEFAKNNDIKYELGENVSTSKYQLKGLVASQSIKPGKKISKDEILKINLYNFDKNYNIIKESDTCYDIHSNLIQSKKLRKGETLNKSYYQSMIYDAQCVGTIEESYSIADTILNQMWKDLQISLSPGQFEALRESQRNWVQEKEKTEDMKIKTMMTIERCNYLLSTYYR